MGREKNYFMADMTWPEVKKAIEEKAVAIIPVGATEAHGPHLPILTDTYISREMARQAANKLDTRGIRSVITPALTYSLTDYAAGFAGTVSVARETAAAMIRDVGVSLGKQGFKIICLANAHLEPGHVKILRDATEEIGRRGGAVVCFPDNTRRIWAEKLTEEFRSGACHAGQYETSLILAIDEKLVDEDARKDLQPNMKSLVDTIKSGAKTFEDAGGPQAYFGDPVKATAEEGKKVYEILSEMVVTVILEALSSDSATPTARH